MMVDTLLKDKNSQIRRKKPSAFNVFPLLTHDPITIEIFAYFDTLKISKRVLIQLNSKGRQLALTTAYDYTFSLFLKSRILCHNHIEFNEALTFKRYKYVQIVRVALFTDGNYPRGIEITYLVDGCKSLTVNYLTKSMMPAEKLQKKHLSIRKGNQIQTISGLRGEHVLHQVTIELSDKSKISVGSARGGERFAYDVPEGFVPYVFAGCFYNGAPFPTLIGLRLLIKPENQPEAQAIECPEKLGFVDLHRHFDPLRTTKDSFIRLVKLEVKSVSRTLLARKGENEQYNIIKGIDIIYSKRNLETGQVEQACEFHTFQDIRLDDEISRHSISFQNPDEYIVNIQSCFSVFITQLEITTNFGTQLKVGSSQLSEAIIRSECGLLQSEYIPPTKNKEINLPKGARVHSISGCYTKHLQSLQAVYN